MKLTEFCIGVLLKVGTNPVPQHPRAFATIKHVINSCHVKLWYVTTQEGFGFVAYKKEGIFPKSL